MASSPQKHCCKAGRLSNGNAIWYNAPTPQDDRSTAVVLLDEPLQSFLLFFLYLLFAPQHQPFLKTNAGEWRRCAHMQLVTAFPVAKLSQKLILGAALAWQPNYVSLDTTWLSRAGLGCLTGRCGSFWPKSQARAPTPKANPPGPPNRQIWIRRSARLHSTPQLSFKLDQLSKQFNSLEATCAIKVSLDIHRAYQRACKFADIMLARFSDLWQ